MVYRYFCLVIFHFYTYFRDFICFSFTNSTR